MTRLLLLLPLLLLACEGVPPAEGEGEEGEGEEGEGEGEGEGETCPGDACVEGCATPIAGFCVASLQENTPITIGVLTDICLSSTCTTLQAPVCNVEVVGQDVFISGFSCFLEEDDPNGCSEDCGGADGANCTVPPLPAGDFVFHVGDAEIALTVPRLTDDVPCLFPGD